jgi:hypothetical protein
MTAILIVLGIVSLWVFAFWGFTWILGRQSRAK